MTKTSFVTLRAAALVAAIVGLVASPSMAQTAAHQHEAHAQAPPSAEQKMDQMKMGEMHKKMMADKMASKAAAADRLNALIAKMKEATGDAKIAAMADVITALAEEHAAMQEHHAMMMKMMATMKPAP